MLATTAARQTPEATISTSSGELAEEWPPEAARPATRLVSAGSFESFGGERTKQMYHPRRIRLSGWPSLSCPRGYLGGKSVPILYPCPCPDPDPCPTHSTCHMRSGVERSGVKRREGVRSG
jgi:hypothetical protein